jgi:hypothetical protein
LYPWPAILVLVIAPLLAAAFGRKAFVRVEVMKLLIIAVIVGVALWKLGIGTRFDQGFIPACLLVVFVPTAAGCLVLWWRAHAAALRRTKPCPHCGYSLIGNVSGICPECGTEVRSIDDTYGACAGLGLERPDQGEFEQRHPIE